MTIVSTAPLLLERTRLPEPVRLPRLLAGLADGGVGWVGGLNQHEWRFGPLPLPDFGPRRAGGRRQAAGSRHAAERRAASRLIKVVERSGLTGRGGAGFPLGRKLRSVAAAQGPAVVVANGAEGEPASHKDRLLLSRAPHLVMDGLSMAAFAVGADQAFLVVHGDDPWLVNGLEGAAQARWVAGIDAVPIEVVPIEPRYVASEQTAIVQHINGSPGLPTFTPPRMHERGVAGRPTAVNNVETLAHLALIARFGDDWFREAGTPEAPGTALVTVSGAVAGPGVYEIELGTPVGEVIMVAGGPIGQPEAVLTGGFFGTWLPAEVAWPVPMSQPGLRTAGAAMGAGILVVLPESWCGLAETAHVVRYLAEESAGQCGPCVFGLPALAGALADLAYQGGRGDATEKIGKLITLIEGRGACRHPDGATQLAASALAAFSDDARWHDHRGPCRRVGRPGLLPVPSDREHW